MVPAVLLHDASFILVVLDYAQILISVKVGTTKDGNILEGFL